MKPRFWIPIGLAVVGLTLVLRHSSSENRLNELPLIVEKLESTGELRTAKLHLSRVFEVESGLKPTGIAAALPGAEWVATKMTRNAALIYATSTVEAGVDLQKARVARSEKGYTITLPTPSLSDPNVKCKVHSWTMGRFYKDIHLTESAETKMEDWSRTAATRSALLEKAKQNARSQVSELLGNLTTEPIEVQFVG